MRQIKAKILGNRRVAQGRFKMRLEAPSICKAARPGQFVMVKCSGSLDPLLRRPFSFHKIEKGHLELLYQVIGRGTELLSQRKKGERLDIIGPLGNGFDIERNPRAEGQRVLVGGGIGAAPLLALAERFATNHLPFKVLLGAKRRGHVLCINDFKGLGAKVEIATEDGSRGHKGLVTDLLKKILRTTHNARRTTIFACGPRPMLKTVAAVAKSKKVTCQVSLEERMACGTGACLGCAIKTVRGFKMVCKDGPIFNAGDILW